jgi:uncharacterized membrane protein YecN with MAPEG domain
MTVMQAAALYVGINILLLLVLALLVVRHRLGSAVSLGDGGVPALTRAVRAHGNATEYVPAALVGLVSLALLGAAPWMVHVGGVLLTLGRIAHGYGLSISDGASPGRQIGTLATWVSFLWIGGAAIVLAFV